MRLFCLWSIPFLSSFWFILPFSLSLSTPFSPIFLFRFSCDLFSYFHVPPLPSLHLSSEKLCNDSVCACEFNAQFQLQYSHFLSIFSMILWFFDSLLVFFPELQTVLLPRVCFRNTVHHFHMKSWWNVQFCVEYLDDVFNLLCTFWQFKPSIFMCQIDELCFNLHNILCIIIWSIFWTIILQNRKSEFSLNLCGKFF